MLEQQLQIGLKAVEEKLQEIAHSRIDLLQDASHHTIMAGGKRLRPQIVMLAYLAAGGKELLEVVPVAAGIELVHTATLVHDDINDHSLTRRGAASVHGKWGRTFALLAGDFLFAKLYELMAPYGAAFNIVMADACVRLVEGETLQAQAAKAMQIDRETYQKIITLKTASLFEAAAKMGGMLGGADAGILQSLERYGRYTGMAFQLADDLLDLVGDAHKLGKPVRLDLAQGRGVAAIQGGNGSSPALLPAPPSFDDPRQALMMKLAGSNAADFAMLQAKELANRAKDALDPLPPSKAKSALLHLADLAVDREM